METIFKLAQALAEAAKVEITRLDIQYNSKSETYSGRCWLSVNGAIFDIHDNGTITLPH